MVTVLICGRTNRSERAEAITRTLREQQGFRTDGGCGRSFDLDNDIQHMGIYRCVECARFLCRPCITAHFEESRHDTQQPRSARVIAATERSAQRGRRAEHTIGRGSEIPSPGRAMHPDAQTEAR